MSIRLRLTLLYCAILVITLIASGIVLYVRVHDATLDATRAALTTEAQSLATALHPHLDPDLGSLSIPPPPAIASQDSIQVRSLDGTVVYRSPDLQVTHSTLPPPDASTMRQMQPGSAPAGNAQPGSAPPGNPVLTTVSLRGKRLLLCTIPLMFANTPVGILQVATSLQQVDQTLNALRQVLLLGGGIVVVLACGAGWALAGTALRPINRITQTAQEIGAAQDFGRRVDYKGPTDEVGRLASTFNTMLERLQAAYHAQRRFVGDASHELRTPLTTIRGNLGLLQREPPIAEADRVAVIADLVSESERLSRLVGDLLTLARSDAGRPLRREPVPLRPLLADLLRRLAVTYPGRVVHEEGHPDATVIGDSDALTQVLLILLDNALKFTPEGGAVSVAIAADGSHVAIAVRDTGPGIAPEALPHIFERFYQGDTSRTGTGAGLGLAIAGVLVEGQHGTIGVESQVGRGSVFTVTMPRATVAQRPALAHVSNPT